MVIFETSIFTKQIQALSHDEEYRILQNSLIESPCLGDIIRGSGGIRKISCKGSGRGKRGGLRVIYYWAPSQDQIFMLFAYAKNKVVLHR